MTAELQVPAPHAHVDTSQGSLLGMDPVEPLPRVCVCGTLLRAPVIRTATDGSVFVDALLLQRDAHQVAMLPVLVVHQWPSADGAYAAHQLVQHLSAGARFGAIGRGLELAHHHGERVLRLVHSDALLTL